MKRILPVAAACALAVRALIAAPGDPIQATNVSSGAIPGWPCSFRTLPPGPFDPYSGMAASDGRHLVFGGGISTASGVLTNFYHYHPDIDMWHVNTPLPVPTINGSLVYAPNTQKYYLFGGEDGAGTVYSTTRVYDMNTIDPVLFTGGTWSTMAAMPAARSQMAAGYFNGKIYLVGGSSGTGFAAQTWEFDPVANSWNTSRADAPAAFGSPGAGVINGHLYVAGGQDAIAGGRNILFDYDIAHNTWTQRATLLAAVNAPGSAVAYGKLVLTGGGVNNVVKALTQIYDPAVDAWANGSPLNTGRDYSVSAVWNNVIYTFGGFDSSGSSSSDFESMGCQKARDDFDGDGSTDRTIFRSGVWYTAASGGSSTASAWGTAGDIDVAGDYDGDGKSDLAVFRPGTGVWYIVNSSNGAISTLNWGVAGDIPLAADIDGDGKADKVVFRPSTGWWYAALSGGGYQYENWGTAGDIPVAADFDGDGKADIAVFRPSTGYWYVSLSAGGSIVMPWGTNGDVPVIGDWDGDGRADIAVWRPSTSTYYIHTSFGDTIVQPWGASGDVPVSGDFNGDGKSDFTVYRPATGVWYTLYYLGGGSAVVTWGGIPGDEAVGRQAGS